MSAASLVQGLRARARGVTLLVALLAFAVIAALLTPEEQTPTEGGLTSYSTAPRGTRVTFELARRMGWRVTRRERLLDSAAAPTVQVIVGAQDALGAREVHRVLENVRRGGGLLSTIDDKEIVDSLGAAAERGLFGVLSAGDAACNTPTILREAVLRGSIAPSVRPIGWRRPAPGQVVALGDARARFGNAKIREIPGAIGFPLGRGRVALAAGADVVTNGAMRTCGWGADVTVARMLEYLQAGSPGQRLVFDEYHHGRGARGGSLSAIAQYLSTTGSGRLFATLLAAGALLLFAAAPRPIVPTEPVRIARRSPLEHADALGRAYLDVTATRTATDRLVSGLRRRTERVVPGARGGDAHAFLKAVVRHMPSLGQQVALLEQALDRQISPRQFAHLADAIGDIERALLTSPTTHA